MCSCICTILLVAVGIIGLVINNLVGQVIGGICGEEDTAFKVDSLKDTLKTTYEKADELMCTSTCQCYVKAGATVNSTGAAGARNFTSVEADGFVKI